VLDAERPVNVFDLDEELVGVVQSGIEPPLDDGSAGRTAELGLDDLRLRDQARARGLRAFDGSVEGCVEFGFVAAHAITP
jgi:hypothetical protein